MEMTLTVHVPRRFPRPAQVVVRWSGEHTAGALGRALSDHLDVPVPALGSRGRPISADAPIGSPPLVHGASLTVIPGVTRGEGSQRQPHGEDAVDERAASPPTAVELVVVGGPDCGHSESVSRSGLTVGRSPDVGLRIEDDSLSRDHACFTATPAGITVEDRGSTNGVVVDGVRLTGVGVVDTSTTIVVGGSTLALRRRPGAGLPVRARGDGRLAIRPTQAPVRTGSAIAVQAPAPPVERRATRVPWVGALVPVPVAVVLAFLFGPQMLAFALLGPTVVLATSLSDRWGSGKEHRRAMVAHRLATEQAARLLAEHVAHECAQRRMRHPDPQRVLTVAEHRQPGLWQHPSPRPIRIGLGDVPAETTWVEGSTTTRPTARLVPVTVDLARAGRLGVVGDTLTTDRLLGSLLGQLVVDMPPTLLHVVLASSEESWGWTHLLPHVVGSPAAAAVSGAPCSRPAPTPVVVVPDAGALGPQDWASCLEGEPLLIVAAPTIEELPSGCTTVLTQAAGQWSLASGEGEVCVTPDLVGSWWTDRVARALAPLCLEGHPGEAPPLPTSLSLPSLLGLAEITPDAVAARWSRARRSANPLARTGGPARATAAAPGVSPPVALVGISSDGPWSIDLRRDGPHVLIGGTTGSGKSEFLRTLVTSLSLSCPPEDLTFVLVDFKGGSAFGSCSALPQVVGLVTDLDDQLVDRALRSLGAELRRRERVFATAGARDLEDYQRRRGPTEAPVPRLVVVIDELRALVEELPDFVSGLIRIAALGRSLGVHLVLATQRPAGTITAEIQANVNLRIAFRVRDRADSVDVLDHPGAAAIPSDAPGRGLARDGDGEIRSFHAATLSHDCAAATPFLTVGTPGPPGSALAQVHPDAGDQPASGSLDSAAGVVEAVMAAHAAAGGSAPRTPWLAPLPRSVPFGTARYHDPAQGPGPAVALVDQPDRQTITALAPPRHPTWLLAGPPGSGRTNAARSVLLASASRDTAADLHLHVIEVASGLADLDALGHLGTRLRAEEHRTIRHLLDLLRAEVDARLHAPRVGPADAAPPEILLVVDGWDQFVEAQPESDHGRMADDLVRVLRDGGSVGVRGLVTGGRSLLQPRWAALGAELFLLGRTDPLDAALAGVATRDALRDPPPGRALRVADAQHVQFVLCSPEDVVATAELLGSTEMAAGGTAADADRRPVRLRPLPSLVQRSSVVDAEGAGHEGCPPGILLGVGGRDTAPLRLDPTTHGRRLAVVGPGGSGRTTALQTLARSCVASGWAVAVVTSSPGEWQGLGGCLVTTPSAPEPVVELRRRRHDLALLVDDANRLDGTAAEQVVREIAGLVERDRGLLVVATTPRAVATRFRGVDVEVCREQAGLLLCPDVGDGEALGARGIIGVPRIPGRGVLIARGSATEVQVLAPEPSAGAVGLLGSPLLGSRLARLDVGPGGEGDDGRHERDDQHRPPQGGATRLREAPAHGQQQQVHDDGGGAGPLAVTQPSPGEDQQRHRGSPDQQGRHRHAAGVAAGPHEEFIDVEHREAHQDEGLHPGDEGSDAAGATRGVH
ncbi:MAG: FtsK/SpoIIIE domain-containing protein [Ornithinibacter sp.]